MTEMKLPPAWLEAAKDEFAAEPVVKESLTPYLAPGFDAKSNRRCKCEFSSGGVLAKSCEFHTRLLRDLQKFARLMFKESDWPEGGDIEGGAFQDAAVECGLLVSRTMFMPCADGVNGYCNCEYTDAPTEKEWSAGWDCYRKAAFLLEPK